MKGTGIDMTKIVHTAIPLADQWTVYRQTDTKYLLYHIDWIREVVSMVI